MENKVEVPVVSAWYSKINLTQVAGLIASLLALKGLNVDPQTLVDLVIGIQAVTGTVTILWKTLFTTSVTPASASKVK